jgi:23S rRNA (pseudouridine1915-N3)-methyltransferase
MKVLLLVVGKARRPFAEAIAEYEKRVRHYFPFEVVEVKEYAARGADESRVMEEEGKRLLAKVPEGAEIIALHRGGSRWSSEQLSQHLAERALHASPGVTFVIGGALGLSEEVLRASTHRLSLSAFTLPHEMARVVMTEQLYRAGTIARGEPYHKG